MTHRTGRCDAVRRAGSRTPGHLVPYAVEAIDVGSGTGISAAAADRLETGGYT